MSLHDSQDMPMLRAIRYWLMPLRVGGNMFGGEVDDHKSSMHNPQYTITSLHKVTLWSTPFPVMGLLANYRGDRWLHSNCRHAYT